MELPRLEEPSHPSKSRATASPILMPLVKSDNARPLLKDALVLDLGDLHRQAQQIIQRAQRESEQILDAARREAQQIIDGADEVGHAQGLERGLDEGREQGRAEARAETIAELTPQIERLIDAWNQALSRWEEERGRMLLSAREDVLAFALTMAQKVVFRMIEADPTVVQDQLAEALSLLAQPTSVTVAINPADRPLVDEVLPELIARCSRCEHARVRDEAEVSRGGCIVRTSGGEIDARVETQIERIVEALLPRAEARSDE